MSICIKKFIFQQNNIKVDLCQMSHAEKKKSVTYTRINTVVLMDISSFIL